MTPLISSRSWSIAIACGLAIAITIVWQFGNSPPSGVVSILTVFQVLARFLVLFFCIRWVVRRGWSSTRHKSN